VLPWAESIDPFAQQSGFAGVVSVDRGGEIEFAQAYGLAERAQPIPNTGDIQLAIDSGTRGLTALTVASLVNDGMLRLSTAARSVRHFAAHQGGFLLNPLAPCVPVSGGHGQLCPQPCRGYGASRPAPSARLDEALHQGGQRRGRRG
jgi:CubicO group peptidase (beta-lactamase class C family)